MNFWQFLTQNRDYIFVGLLIFGGSIIGFFQWFVKRIIDHRERMKELENQPKKQESKIVKTKEPYADYRSGYEVEQFLTSREEEMEM